MDLVSSCKEKLAYFRIKELKEVLTKLGLPKQGKKQDLADRISAFLSDERVAGIWAKKNVIGREDVAKAVDDVYRKMQVSGASDLASKGPVFSDSSNTIIKEEIDDTYQLEKVRCPCGSSLQADSMIKCEDRRCNVWQHIVCVIIPEKPTEGVPPVPPQNFYCEICRLSRADPFWVTVAHPLHPVKLLVASVPSDGTSPVQSVEKTFQLTRADRDLLSKPDYDVQAWCMLLSDKVAFRMHWPQYADLQVNGVPVRAINRPGSQLLGANGRDDGPIITPCTRDGINKISLTGCDARVFCLGVRIVKRRTIQQILNLVPKESDGEPFEDALARVRRCVGGGATENADSDSDLEVVADSVTVSLRCPNTSSRMKVAGRFKPCVHMGCFDLDVFVELNQRSRKWQCPICLKNYSLEHLIIDPYFNRITSKMRNCGEDVADVEVKPDGSWRAKAESDRRGLGDLGQWHFPDGSLCVPMDVDVKPKIEVLKQVKQEGVSEGHPSLKIGIRKNRNGLWEFSKTEDPHSLSSGNRKLENMENNGHNVIPMSSSATGSVRDGEDHSVNQGGAGGRFDYSVNNGADLDSLSRNNEPTYGFVDRNLSDAVRGAEVIVLSDSDEENENPLPSEPVYNNGRPDAGKDTFCLPNGTGDPHPEDPALGNGASSCHGFFNTNDDNYGVNFWSLPPTNQAPNSFQLFAPEVDVSGSLGDLHHGSLGCPTQMDGLVVAEENAMRSSALVSDLAHHHSNGGIDDGLIDNPLAFSGDDPSLQLFLPAKPSEATKDSDFRDRPAVPNGLHSDDWISLRLGGCGSGVHGEPPASNDLNSRQELPSKEGALNSPAASLLLGMSDSKSGKTSREISGGPFTFPRQRRSVRPRLYLSIDYSDSEGS